ncbi:DUF4229 domain-containing protein [Agromyces archimandritae]|uniref:DUF4229 domain-containing protein n=1 Tax=Agromyces archimandritae TaxID=2781962 RepID=A0A975FLG7_9MICO|nr:DUF4229 domain-containing protein [Agromyces archimandritae]QTX03628.1 DUF4229 domain-containing protein [Agromyces archimandritae]
MKSVPVWVWYSVLRVLLFAVPLGVLLAFGVNVWVSTIIAAVFGFSASFLFLRRARESMSRDLYDLRHPTAEPVRDDDAAEDAAIDAAGDR